MDFLEKDLEDVVYEAYRTGNQNFLLDRGLTSFTHDYVFRQLNLGDYGISDLIGVTFYPSIEGSDMFRSFVNITVYELKKDSIGIDTFSQASRYAKGIELYLKSQGVTEYEFKFVLIGRTINVSNNDNLCFFQDVMSNVLTYTYSYGFDGIRFEKTASYKKGNGSFGSQIGKSKIAMLRIFSLLRTIKKSRYDLKEKEWEQQWLN